MERRHLARAWKKINHRHGEGDATLVYTGYTGSVGVDAATPVDAAAAAAAVLAAPLPLLRRKPHLHVPVSHGVTFHPFSGGLGTTTGSDMFDGNSRAAHMALGWASTGLEG
jgi:hypothetical protein